MRTALTSLNKIVRPATSIIFRGLHQPTPDILNIQDFTINTKENLSEKTFGSETVHEASHDVLKATYNKQPYAVKLMNKARVGEESKVVTYPFEEALQQSVLEVLATKVGRVLCPGQFTEADVATDGKDNCYVVSKFIPNAVSLRELRSGNYMEPKDRDESVFYLGKTDEVELRTKTNIPSEHLKLPHNLKDKMKREGFSIADALVSGRIDLKMALYILGEKDEILNRDGNILIIVKNYNIDAVNKIITPEVKPIAVDCGLCFGRSSPKEDMVNQAFKLAIREKDSHQMGLELDGLPPSNLKKIKDNFLKRLVGIYESKAIDNHVTWAARHLSEENMKPIADMQTRLTTCYLAGKCIEANLDKPEKEQEAKLFLKNVLEKQRQAESTTGRADSGR